MGELFESMTKEERMEIDREWADKQKMEQDLKKTEYYKKNRIKSGAELKKYKETKLSKNLKTELQIEWTPHYYSDQSFILLFGSIDWVHMVLLLFSLLWLYLCECIIS